MRKLISLVLFLSSTLTGFGQANTLKYYLEAAIQGSPVFADLQNQFNSLTLDSLLLRATFGPKVNFTSNNTYAPVINGYGYDELITNRGNYNALLGMNYNLLGKNAIENRNITIQIQKQILELNLKLSEQDLKQSVTSQFITIYGEQQILSTSEKVLNIFKEEEFILKSMAEKGTYKQTEYLTFLATYKQAQLSYSQLKLQAQTDLNILNYLCGLTDTAYLNLPDPSIRLKQNISSEQTYQFHKFVYDSLNFKNSYEQLKFNYKPKLSLFGDAGYNTTFMNQSQRNFGASAGFSFSVPIYDGNQRKMQEGKLKLTENTRTLYAEYYKKQYSIKQQQLLQQIAAYENILTEALSQLEIQENLMNANKKLLETGDVRVTDYLFSITNFISAQATVQQLQTNKLQLMNTYNFLNY